MTNVSIKEVAELAGVSIATVSRCMNSPDKVSKKTRTKVQDAILETGYTPNTLARNFRRGRTNIVMVVLPSIGVPFFTPVVEGVRNAAEARGYSIIIIETQNNTMTADDISSIIVSRQTDGIILLASVSPFGTEVASAKNRRVLPIVIGCETIAPELSGFPSVHVDNIAAAKDATRYLISEGHQQIGLICGPSTSLLTKDREYGYCAAMRDAGLTIEDGWIVDGDNSIDGSISATRSLLNHDHRPTAIFCTTDEMAIGCLHAIKSTGLRIPEDISVMGFDDVRYAAVTDPPLTTIRQPAVEIGERVMYRLCREIDSDRQGGATDNTPELLPHQLVVRDSVASYSA